MDRKTLQSESTDKKVKEREKVDIPWFTQKTNTAPATQLCVTHQQITF